MTPTVAVTGMLPFAVLVAALLAVPVSLALLAMYRRAVKRGMFQSASPMRLAGEPKATESNRRAGASPLNFASFGADLAVGAPVAPGASPALVAALSQPWRAATVYAIAGGGYAAVMTLGWLLSTADPVWVWTKLALLFWTYFWPTVITTTLVAAYERRQQLRILGVYAAILFLLIGIAAARSPDVGLAALLLYWLIENLPATVLVMAFLWQPIRAVGLLVLSFLVALSVGSAGVLWLVSEDESVLRGFALLGSAFGLGAHAVFGGMVLVGLTFGALLGWPLLRALGRRYEQQRFSDQQIRLSALWLLFGTVQSIGLAFESPPWVLTGLVAFLAAHLAERQGLRQWVTLAAPRAPTTLLLLRVFALGPRSAYLLDRLRTHWLYAGRIAIVAGPDLVTTTVEPHEFLDFVSGRLSRCFVQDATDLAQRIARAPQGCDPDGRYRIDEYFCHNDTWKITMERLAAMSDAVLMDLRSFSSQNKGCIFELGRLLDGVDLRRVVFLVDGNTQLDLLRLTMQGLWQHLAVASPNNSVAGPTVRLFQCALASQRDLHALLRLLLSPV